MIVRYLLDTNVISELSKYSANSRVKDLVEKHQAHCALASLTWLELWFGYHRMPTSRRKYETADFFHSLRHFPILNFDKEAAEWLGLERARLVSEGKTPSYIDGQIAAIAKRNNLTLVTRNIKDFKHFSNLLLENWFA